MRGAWRFSQRKDPTADQPTTARSLATDRRLAVKDLDAAYREVLKKKIAYLLLNKKAVHPRAWAALKALWSVKKKGR